MPSDGRGVLVVAEKREANDLKSLHQARENRPEDQQPLSPGDTKSIERTTSHANATEFLDKRKYVSRDMQMHCQ